MSQNYTDLPNRDKVTEVIIGAGKVVSNWGTYYGRPCVFLQPTPNGAAGNVGEKLAPEVDYQKDQLPDGTVILVFEGPPDVFLADVNSALADVAAPERN